MPYSSYNVGISVRFGWAACMSDRKSYPVINLYSPALRFMLRVGDAAHRLRLIKFSVLVDGLDGMIDSCLW